MDNNSKLFAKSLALWGVVVALFCHFIYNRTGVNVSDQVGALQQTIQALINTLPPVVAAIGQFAGVIAILVGRFRAKQPLHILPPNSSKTGTSPLLATGLICAAVLGLAGCASSGSGTSTPSGGGSSTAPSSADVTIEAALPLIHTGAAVATGAVLDFAVKQDSTRTRLANEMYSAANAIYSLSGGTLPTPEQFSLTILAFGGSQQDASYVQFISSISGLYSTYYAKATNGSASAKTATDVLNAIAGGIEDATQSYVAAPASATTGSF